MHDQGVVVEPEHAGRTEFDALSSDESSERPASGTTDRLLALCKSHERQRNTLGVAAGLVNLKENQSWD